MTRVATPENESYLLNIAQHGTAAHVDRLVCNYLKVQRIAERQRANTLHEERWVKFHHDDDGALVLEARLPPETGAIVLEALAAAGEAMYVRRREFDAAGQAVAAEKNSAESSPNEGLYLPPGPAEAIAEDPDTPWWARDTNEKQPCSALRADALVLMAESLLANGAASRPAGERHHIVVHACPRRGLTRRCLLTPTPPAARSWKTARSLPARAPGGSPATRASYAWWKTPMACRSTLAARPAASPPPFTGRSGPGMVVAASPAVPPGISSRVTTWSTGPTAVKPACRTWCNCVTSTIAWCTKVDTVCVSPETKRSHSPAPAAASSRRCRKTPRSYLAIPISKP